MAKSSSFGAKDASRANTKHEKTGCTLRSMDSADTTPHFSPSSNAASQASRKAPPSSSPYTFEHLSDAELLLCTRSCVARSNQQLAALLAHLAEVEAREIYRQRACASLCIFCIYELRMSEDSAFRHARAARIASQFPVLFGLIAAGEIHLTGVILIGPYLTEENHRELLLRVKHRSKREITKIVRLIDPLPDVPPRIDPLGPALSAQPQTNSSWQAFLDSRLPVRELPPGQRPADWLEFGAEIDDTMAGNSETDASETDASERSEPAGATPRLAAQRYKVQFQASQEYVDLLEKATDLLPYAARTRALEEVHLRAMRLLVAELEKRKYGLTKHPRARGRSTNSKGAEPEQAEPEQAEPEQAEPEQAEPEQAEPERAEPVAMVSALSTPEIPRRRGSSAGQFAGAGEGQGAAGGSRSDEDDRSAMKEKEKETTPRRRGRYIPVEARRTVRERDGGRCTYVAADGTRCRETSCLEVHHLDPYSRGGPPTSENLTLRCRPHNALAAEEDFGRAHMARRLGRD
jgi:hypothetical protein